MRKVYQSYDGLIFENEDECAEHEKKHPAFIMYNSFGETHNPSRAFLVVIKDKSGAESFISLCNEYETLYPGIDRDSTGIFVWTHDQFYDAKHYVKIPDSILKALNHYFSDIK